MINNTMMHAMTATLPAVAGPPATAASVSVAAFAAAPARPNYEQMRLQGACQGM